jgi:hypothetical protein
MNKMLLIKKIKSHHPKKVKKKKRKYVDYPVENITCISRKISKELPCRNAFILVINSKLINFYYYIE